MDNSLRKKCPARHEFNTVERFMVFFETRRHYEKCYYKATLDLLYLIMNAKKTERTEYEIMLPDCTHDCKCMDYVCKNYTREFLVSEIIEKKDFEQDAIDMGEHRSKKICPYCGHDDVKDLGNGLFECQNPITCHVRMKDKKKKKKKKKKENMNICKDCKHCAVINEQHTWHFCLKYTDFEKVRQHTNPVTGEVSGEYYAKCKKINKKGNCKGFEQRGVE